MYAENVIKILSDVTTPQKIVRKVLRDNNMQIVKKFSPIKSEYKFQLPDNKRISMVLTEDEFYQKEEKLIKNQWETVQEFHMWDGYEQIDDALARSISKLVDLGAKFTKYRNIK